MKNKVKRFVRLSKRFWRNRKVVELRRLNKKYQVLDIINMSCNSGNLQLSLSLIKNAAIISAAWRFGEEDEPIRRGKTSRHCMRREMIHRQKLRQQKTSRHSMRREMIRRQKMHRRRISRSRQKMRRRSRRAGMDRVRNQLLAFLFPLYIKSPRAYPNCKVKS
jgi:hypothetical protein